MYIFILVLLILPWSYSFIKLEQFHEGFIRWVLHLMLGVFISFVVAFVAYSLAISYYPSSDYASRQAMNIGLIAALGSFILCGVYTCIIGIKEEKKMYAHRTLDEES